jgi:hypothetical protein
MQARFVDFTGFLPVPYTARKYLIDMNGNVLSTENNALVVETESYIGERLTKIFDGLRWLEIKVATLLAIVSKRIKIPSDLWHLLDVQYVDGNPKNIHPSNTVWKYPEAGLFYKDSKSLRYIPGFSRYLCDVYGNVYSTSTYKFLSPYIDKMGYTMYGVAPDVGNRTILGKHRAIALSFLPYNSRVDTLDVNHLDGVKGNNLISNLEWARRKRNCDHAYSTGLRTDNLITLMRNAYTGEVTQHYSLEECARQIGMDGETIRLRVKSQGQKVYPPGYQFKLLKDETEWIDFEDPTTEMQGKGSPLGIIATDLKTGEVLKFESRKKFSTFLNVSNSTVCNYFSQGNGVSCIIRGYLAECDILTKQQSKVP